MNANRILSYTLAATVALAAPVLAGPEHNHDEHGHDDHGNDKAMHATVGEKAPDFTLTDTDGNTVMLSEILDGETMVVLEWFNPDCPFVKKHHIDNKSMADTYKMASEHDVVWLAINSGAPGNQGAGLEHNQKAIEDYGIAYPVLLDESGKVGMMYGAKTTPHMYVIDTDGTLVYAGAIDNVPNPKELGDVNYVTSAVNACASGEKVEMAETKPYGCSVKYAKNESAKDPKKESSDD